MKNIFRVFVPLLTIALIYFLNTKHGILPPLGKFLDPVNGFWQNAENINVWNNEQQNMNGLKEEVKVYFDERLVPHVFAKNDEDLYFMQGYITAKYRLWQMEISTHAAAGRLTEIVGEKALENDQLMRRTGMAYGAEEAQKFIDEDTASKILLQAYCNGINAYIKTLAPKDYPIEYKLLDYTPEEWKPIKVGLLLKNMSNMLSIFEWDIENTNFISKYGKEEFAKLYPDFIPDEDPIIPKGTKYQINYGIGCAIDKHSMHEQTANVKSETELFANALQKPDEITGSNNWAVSGSKTKSGKPILCNDPHLRLSLPSIWYEMQLVSPNMNVYGATLPGSPCVIIGFNDSIAWGVTNGGRDVRDWYKMEFKDSTLSEYKMNDEWLKSTRREEVYHIRGKADYKEEVTYTMFGPVVFDKNFGTAPSRKNLSMRWMAHLPSNEFKTFYNLNKGKNYDDYLHALDYYTCPAQNFVFASRSGDIAIKEQGRFAIRDKYSKQGLTVCDGTTRADGWGDYIPYEDNPMIKNPERGFVSSANQHPTDSTYPYYYPGVGVYENYRNRRINKLLSENDSIDAQYMMEMHSDNYNLNAAEALPVLLSLLDTSNLNKADRNILVKLRAWNFFNNPGEVAPVFYEIWWNELRKILWDEMLDKNVPMKQPNFYNTVTFLRTDAESQFYDNLSTDAKETRHDVVLQSFLHVKDTLVSKQFAEVSEAYKDDETYTMKNLNPQDWGTYKKTKVEHLGRIDAFSALNVYNGGNAGIVNATNSTNGPSWRMIVDFGEMKQYVIYPGGQSGNPGSKFYMNGVKEWAKGKYYTANFIHSGEDLGKKTLFTNSYSPSK